MREIKGDIMQLIETGKYEVFCITTNGSVKAGGLCVMGRGIAQTCRDRYKGIDKVLGSRIIDEGNHVHMLGYVNNRSVLVISFPVKHLWYETADINLIRQSCKELMTLISHNGLNEVLLPRPGCGNGKLKWTDVKPVIENILDDRVTVATF